MRISLFFCILFLISCSQSKKIAEAEKPISEKPSYDIKFEYIPNRSFRSQTEMEISSSMMRMSDGKMNDPTGTELSLTTMTVISYGDKTGDAIPVKITYEAYESPEMDLSSLKEVVAFGTVLNNAFNIDSLQNVSGLTKTNLKNGLNTAFKNVEIDLPLKSLMVGDSFTVVKPLELDLPPNSSYDIEKKVHYILTDVSDGVAHFDYKYSTMGDMSYGGMEAAVTSQGEGYIKYHIGESYVRESYLKEKYEAVIDNPGISFSMFATKTIQVENTKL